MFICYANVKEFYQTFELGALCFAIWLVFGRSACRLLLLPELCLLPLHAPSARRSTILAMHRLAHFWIAAVNHRCGPMTVTFSSSACMHFDLRHAISRDSSFGSTQLMRIDPAAPLASISNDAGLAGDPDCRGAITIDFRTYRSLDQ